MDKKFVIKEIKNKGNLVRFYLGYEDSEIISFVEKVFPFKYDVTNVDNKLLTITGNDIPIIYTVGEVFDFAD